MVGSLSSAGAALWQTQTPEVAVVSKEEPIPDKSSVELTAVEHRVQGRCPANFPGGSAFNLVTLEKTGAGHFTTSAWEKLFLIHHVGAWEPGAAAQSKYDRYAIQDERFSLINNTELYDLKDDPGENRNVLNEYPEVVGQLRTRYERWWTRVLPRMVYVKAYARRQD